MRELESDWNDGSSKLFSIASASASASPFGKVLVPSGRKSVSLATALTPSASASRTDEASPSKYVGRTKTSSSFMTASTDGLASSPIAWIQAGPSPIVSAPIRSTPSSG